MATGWEEIIGQWDKNSDGVGWVATDRGWRSKKGQKGEEQRGKVKIDALAGLGEDVGGAGCGIWTWGSLGSGGLGFYFGFLTFFTSFFIYKTLLILHPYVYTVFVCLCILWHSRSLFGHMCRIVSRKNASPYHFSKQIEGVLFIWMFYFTHVMVLWDPLVSCNLLKMKRCVKW